MKDLNQNLDKILPSIPPERREEFKRVFYHQEYLRSHQFAFIWFSVLFYLNLPLTYGGYLVFPGQKYLWVLLMCSFLVTIVALMLFRNLKSRFNRKGVGIIHALFIIMPIFYGISIYGLLRQGTLKLVF